MSLLIDALKNAEKAKEEKRRQAAAAESPATEPPPAPPQDFPVLELAPADSPPETPPLAEPAKPPEPPPALELAPADIPPQTEAAPAPAEPVTVKAMPAREEPATPVPAPQTGLPKPPPAAGAAVPEAGSQAGDRIRKQEAAKTVFAAKTRPAKKPVLWLGAGLAVALAIMLAGAWWWLETLSKPSLAPVAAPVAARAPAATPPAAPVAEAKPEPSPAPEAEKVQPPVPAPGSSAAPARAASAQEPPPPRQERPAESPIRIRRESPQAGINPVLVQAYEAYRRGDLATASALYRQVAATDPDNRDARLGLAAIAMHNGKPDEAAAIYARLLERDPRDAAAHAGLASLSGAEDAQALETRLKLLLSRDPQADALHFALGSVYAKQSRWAEAQQSYFNAFAAAPDNPDHAYNLAVSLDMLGQQRLAAEHYEKALALASAHPHRFAAEAARNRLAVLRKPH